jgi:hypothetical protein
MILYLVCQQKNASICSILQKKAKTRLRRVEIPNYRLRFYSGKILFQSWKNVSRNGLKWQVGDSIPGQREVSESPLDGGKVVKAFLKCLVKGEINALKRGLTPNLTLDSYSEGLLQLAP